MPPTGPSQPDAPARPAPGGAAALSPAVLKSLATAATRTKRFDSVEIKSGELVCTASGTDSPAFYKVCIESDKPCISLVMADRYLSQSIEQDLVHNGDKLADLLSDELIDANVQLPLTCPPLTVDHFRDTKKLFTFRTLLPQELVSTTALTGTAATGTESDQHLNRLLAVLMAYESCFSRLGGMSAGSDED